MPRPMILLNSRSGAAVIIVFSGADLALDPVSRDRRSHSSAPTGRFVPHPRSSIIETVARGSRRPQLGSSAAVKLALLPQR